MKLVLFDVDGTLLEPKGDNKKHWAHMFKEVFGIDNFSWKRHEGQTEGEIIRTVAAETGIDEETIESKMKHAARILTEIYFNNVEIIAMVGAKELLEATKANEEIKIMMLTGNTEERAHMKLKKAGLNGYLKIGAFTTDAKKREDLFPVALDRAEKEFGIRFEPKNVWIIGDTPRDIFTAKHNDANCIVVATGPWDENELARELPDFVVKDLSDYKRIINIILGKEE